MYKSFLLTGLLAASIGLAHADDAQRQTSKPCPSPASSTQKADPGCAQTTGLLLPAVQKVRAADAPQPQRTATPQMQPQRAVPAQPAQPARQVRSLNAQDFKRLMNQHHRSGRPIPGEAPAAVPSSGAATKMAAPSATPKYEINDCGNGQVCCSYSGENSTCNLFMYLCTSQGGQATGDKNEAVCTF